MSYDINEIKRKSIVNYAEGIGYEVNEKKSSRRTCILYNEFGDSVMVGKDVNGIEYYKNLHLKEDKGSIIDFAINRIRGGGGVNISNDKTDYLEALEKINGYKIENKSKNKSKNLLQKGNNVFDIDSHKIIQTTTHEYLNNRGISNETISNDIFKGRILYVEKNGHVNVGFPYFKGEEIRGLELRNEKFKHQVSGSQKNISIFKSNTQDDDKCFIAESPIDALSYFQLTKERGTYIATGGTLAKGQIEEIYKTLKKGNITKINFITDNDFMGMKYVNDVIQKEFEKIFTIDSLIKNEKTGNWNFTLKFENNLKLKEFENNLDSKGIQKKVINNNISINLRSKDVQIFRKVNQILINSFSEKIKFKMKLSKGKDWNVDLTTSKIKKKKTKTSIKKTELIKKR